MHAKTHWEHLHFKKNEASLDFKGPIVLFLLQHFANLSELLAWIYLRGRCFILHMHNPHARLGVNTNTFCFLHSRPHPNPHTHIHAHFLLVIPVIRLGRGLAGELVKRLGTSCKVQPSRKDSHWAWRCSLGFTGLLSNYSILSFLRFLPTTSTDSSFPVWHILLTIQSIINSEIAATLCCGNLLVRICAWQLSYKMSK